MNDREPPIDEAHARELLQRERERIEAQLADVERLRRSELEEIESATDPDDDSGADRRAGPGRGARRAGTGSARGDRTRREATRGRHVWLLGGERRADTAGAARGGSVG